MPEIVAIERPQRWDVPFGPDMTEADVDHLLSIAPFKNIDANKFPESTPLRGILLNDTRIVSFKSGDLIVREGDYGHSAFLILRGKVRVVLDSLPPRLLGRQERKRKTWFESLSQWWANPRLPEVRNISKYQEAKSKGGVAQRDSGGQTHVFLQDVPAVLGKHKTVELTAGALFGELAALGRIPRTATIFAEGNAELLEIRWQGLRDLRRRDDALKKHIDALYRKNALLSFLGDNDLFAHLNEEQLKEVAAATEFETHGGFEWYATYKSVAQQSASDKLAQEPVISEEGHYANGLVLIRSGFARISQRFGNGHRTLSYAGAGQTYGLQELAHSWRSKESVPLQSTLRAVGYVDILRVPSPLVEKYVLPHLKPEQLPPMIKPAAAEPEKKARSISLPLSGLTRFLGRRKERQIETGLLEFLVENRFINGTAAMVIDLDRCTRCDDCVRACAAAHENNPKFIRHGHQHDHYMVANACMHCADPVCMIGCPTGAIGREPTSGQVVINDTTCIGCATCANSCPYNNIRMVEIRDGKGDFILDTNNAPIVKATKCDLCVDQLGGPACERACPHDAMKRVDMRDTDRLATWVSR